MAANGRIIAQGESHTRKADAERAVATVQETAGQIAHLELMKRLKGKGDGMQRLRGKA